MQQGYRFQFMKGKKETCPSCNSKRTYRRYIDIETGEVLPLKYGRCDREDKCRYYLNPYIDKYHHKGNDFSFTYNYYSINQIKQVEHNFFIPQHILDETKSDYNYNSFIQNLLYNLPYPFNYDEVYKLIELYQLGTINNGYMKGAITFPFIDINQRVNAIQCKLFDKSNHTVRTNFLHSIIQNKLEYQNKIIPKWLENYQKNENKVRCLFGEHLLNKYHHNPIALVEAPKTALYGSIYFGLPDNPKNYLWLAVYNKSSLNYKKCKALKNRKVVLFPDTSIEGKTFKEWQNRVVDIQNNIQDSTFQVSDLLENLSTNEQKENGIDLADLLTNLDWNNFRTLQNNVGNV